MQLLTTLTFQDAFYNDIQHPTIQITDDILNWEGFWKDLDLVELQQQFQKLRSTRSLWLAVNRNSDPSKPSTLFGIRSNNLNANQSQEGTNVLFAYKFIQQDIVKKIKNTKMFLEPATLLDYDKMWESFQQWEHTKLLSREEIDSWKPIKNAIENLMNKSCKKCSLLKQKKKLYNLRKNLDLVTPAARQKQQRKLKDIETKLEMHLQTCSSKSKVDMFHHCWNKIYWNNTKCHHNLLNALFSEHVTDNFINECQTKSKWKSPAIKRIFTNPFSKTRVPFQNKPLVNTDIHIPVHHYNHFVDMPICDFQVCHSSDCFWRFFCRCLYFQDEFDARLCPQPEEDNLPTGTVLILPWENKQKTSDKWSPVALFLIYQNKNLQSLHRNCYTGYYLNQEQYQTNKHMGGGSTLNLCGLFNIVPFNSGITNFLPFGHQDSLQLLYVSFYEDYYGLVVPPFTPIIRNTYYLKNVSSNWDQIVPDIKSLVKKFQQNIASKEKQKKRNDEDEEMKETADDEKQMMISEDQCEITLVPRSDHRFRLHNIDEYDKYFTKPFSKLPSKTADLLLFSIPTIVLKRLHNHKLFRYLVPTFELNMQNFFERYGTENEDSNISDFFMSDLKEEIVDLIEKNNLFLMKICKVSGYSCFLFLNRIFILFPLQILESSWFSLLNRIFILLNPEISGSSCFIFNNKDNPETLQKLLLGAA